MVGPTKIKAFKFPLVENYKLESNNLDYPRVQGYNNMHGVREVRDQNGERISKYEHKLPYLQYATKNVVSAVIMF